MFEADGALGLERVGGRSSSTTMDRRAWERHASNLRVSCGRIADGTEPRLTARVKDICPGGIGLVVQRPYQPGTVLVLRIHTHAQNAPGVLFARVVHVRAHTGIEWITGCTFASPLDEEEYRALMS
jgi:hypothetical protein